MSTFNPGTNEPTPEQGSAPEGEERPSENPQVDEVTQRDNDDTENTGTTTTYDTGHGHNPGKHNPSGDNPDQVPDTVADIKAWLDDADTDTERTRRVNLVERAERTRGGDPRQGVQKAIDDARRAR